ncbi:hypothetical protein Pcinc_009268 [Petrolisthes cinctipes]|uniref:Uncharacterized protein n=1 Tax=Petrolisthes cinctipes TaxID=88211 RepID=A0AAE1G7T5_PETCI|nr:hypothetical protein Pcinc_009268 [Petrolisthes cinctipes]
MRKSDWVTLANFYKVEIKSGSTKSELKECVLQQLVLKEILSLEALDLIEDKQSSDNLMQLKRLELEDKKAQRAHELLLKEIEANEREKERQFFIHNPAAAMSNSSNDFDVSKNIKFVPKFDEDSPDDFFCLFEKIAKHMEWPTSRWSFLAQSVFVGKARSVFVSLQDDKSNNYVILKECVLGAYDQIPENHRQKFRKCKIEESQTYLEFVRHKTKLFDRAKQKGNDVTRRASHLYSQQGGKSSLSGASLPDSSKTFETSSELPFVSKPDTPAFAITRNMTRNNHDVLDNNAYGSNVNDNPSGFDISSLFEDSTVDSESSKNTQVQDHLPSDHACVLEKLLKTFPQICGDVPR